MKNSTTKIINDLKYGKGYSIFKIEKINFLKKIRNTFITKINESKNKKKVNVNSIRSKMAKMKKSEINNAMIRMLSFNNLSEMMILSCPSLIKKLCGKELFIQRRAHTIVNVPGKGQSKQWPHYEMISGISPHSYIIWTPLHDLEDEGGIYYVDQKTSADIMKKEEKFGLVNGPKVLNLIKNQKPAKLKFGEGIIFNPFVIHGNLEFKSNLARIACNVRFQSIRKPLLQKNTDYLKYFKIS